MYSEIINPYIRDSSIIDMAGMDDEMNNIFKKSSSSINEPWSEDIIIDTDIDGFSLNDSSEPEVDQVHLLSENATIALKARPQFHSIF